jgi:hypothetical protein
MLTRVLCLASGFGLAALSAAPCLAVDGVVEINEARALAGDVTPGDTPGFPVTLSRPGSYRLTSRLATSSKSTTAILVTSDDVTLDLNGFTIACAFVVEGGAIPAGCLALSGPGDGVGVDVATRARTSVRNGVIRDMEPALRCRWCATIVENRLSNTGENGIRMLDSSSTYAHNVVALARQGAPGQVIRGGRRVHGGLDRGRDEWRPLQRLDAVPRRRRQPHPMVGRGPGSLLGAAAGLVRRGLSRE